MSVTIAAEFDAIDALAAELAALAAAPAAYAASPAKAGPSVEKTSLGDLVATCSSPLSRNRTFGERLGRGMTVAQATEASRQVAEGVKSCEPILGLAERVGVEMPIVALVAEVVRGEAAPAEMLERVMMRTAKPDAKFATFTDSGQIADAIAFLLSPAAEKMNGQRLALHG